MYYDYFSNFARRNCAFFSDAVPVHQFVRAVEFKMATGCKFLTVAVSLSWSILRENNVELSKNTLFFYLKKVLEDHKDLYNSMSARIGINNVLKNLVSIYQELEPLNFGRIVAYLTMVSKIKCESQSK